MPSERAKAIWRESLSAFHLGRHGCDDEAAALAIDKHLATPPPASADALGEVERVAKALAGADGLDWDEVCGVDADPDEGYCDSGTCVAAHWEDHDAEQARRWYMHLATAALSAMSPAGEVGIPWNDEVAFILGRPSFTLIHEAQLFRSLGYDIPKRAESEQAFFIHRWLGLYFKHGAEWRDKATEDMRDHVEKSRALAPTGDAP